jgi:dethiobiotin synthetase
MKRYFITGTDTDCGKTYVTTQLLNYHAHALAIKPISSGGLLDAKLLQQHNSLRLSLDEINPWQFKLPVSPHIAAEEEGASVSLAEVADFCLTSQWPGIKTLFIEGAGGLCVPLTPEETWIDFLKQTNIPVILVVGMKLGCINHALLTQTALLAHGIQCLGWIANCPTQSMDCLEKNKETLEKKLKFPMLTALDFGGSIEKMAMNL